jgi:hypothetical protein
MCGGWPEQRDSWQERETKRGRCALFKYVWELFGDRKDIWTHDMILKHGKRNCGTFRGGSHLYI